MNFIKFMFKAIIVHTLTYFICGLIFSNLFHYDDIFQIDVIKNFMRGYDSPMIMLGPILQPIRGLIFALGIWPIKKIIIDQKYGWLVLWNIIVLFGILSTPSAAPASIEGMIYSKLPLWYHFIGYPELLTQTFLFSLIVVTWEKGQLPKIIIWLMLILTILVFTLLVVGGVFLT